MSKATDKYHKLIKDDYKHLNPLFDIKEVSKRVYQLGIAALFTGIVIAIYDSFLGLYVSSFLVLCFCFAILMFILLKYQEAIKSLSLSIIGMVCCLLIVSMYLEGPQSEEYLYFFPMLVAVPIIVNLKQTQYRESFLYIFIILLAFTVSIFIGRHVTPVEIFTVTQITKLAFFNRVIAISSTIVFAMAYIILEKKYINELMEQSKRMIDSRSQFLATMSHELRTPLNGIIGVINLLKQDHTPSQHGEYLQTLKYCSDHMLQQVNNILDFNKLEAEKLEIHPVELNLKQLLLNAGIPFFSLFKEKGVDLKIEIDPALDTLVLADDLRLIQIFNNLLSNALKFTDRGFVQLEVKCKVKDKNFVEAAFSVTDTGIGIDENDQKKIFESFWQVYDENTRKFTGTGLGLTICVRLLKLMNSKLNLVSEKGKGSKFSFDLKFEYADAKKQSSSVLEKAEDDLAGIRILLAEDNLVNMMVAKKILSGFKATAICVYNGKEALEALQKDSAFDIILLDLEMPVMNGYTAIFEIKKSYPHIPVIAFTASLVDQKMLSDLLESGFSDCITKPFQPHQLLAGIKKHLSKPPIEVNNNF
ncbi:MAG TPA: ATP-binding protein [Mucilaginibacter sp.]|jgi:signal transduction histidine kinase/CheY-like chemotaxis protein